MVFDCVQEVFEIVQTKKASLPGRKLYALFLETDFSQRALAVINSKQHQNFQRSCTMLWWQHFLAIAFQVFFIFVQEREVIRCSVSWSLWITVYSFWCTLTLRSIGPLQLALDFCPCFTTQTIPDMKVQCSMRISARRAMNNSWKYPYYTTNSFLEFQGEEKIFCWKVKSNNYGFDRPTSVHDSPASVLALNFQSLALTSQSLSNHAPSFVYERRILVDISQ